MPTTRMELIVQIGGMMAVTISSAVLTRDCKNGCSTVVEKVHMKLGFRTERRTTITQRKIDSGNEVNYRHAEGN